MLEEVDGDGMGAAEKGKGDAAAAAAGETQHAWFIYPNSSSFHMQGSYHVGNTASRLISEVKQR